MKKFKEKLVSTLLVLMFASVTALSQAAIKTADGLLFVNNNKDKSFKVEIKGKEVKTLESSQPMFVVDGKVLQIIIVPKSNFMSEEKQVSDEQFLEAHKIWETDYLTAEIYRKKLLLETEKLSFGDRKALFWGFNRPSQNQEFDRDYFLTTGMGSYLLGFGSPATPKQSKAEIQKFLTELMKNLVVSDKSFDITKLAEEIRNAPDKKSN